MGNNKYDAILKKLEENHFKRFKDNDDYIEKCKNSKDLNPKDYKIIPNHKLEEYFAKYGKKLEKGKLLLYKRDELWLMNKTDTYWEIENDSEFVYFASKHINKKAILIVATISCLLAGGLLFTGLKLLTNHKITMVNTDNCTCELDKANYNFNDIATATLTTFNDYSLPETLNAEGVTINGGNFVSYEYLGHDEEANITTSELKIQVKTGDINFSVPVSANEHEISISGPHIDSVTLSDKYRKDEEAEIVASITEGHDFHLPDDIASELTLTNCTLVNTTPVESYTTTKCKVKVKVGTGETTKKGGCNVTLQKTVQNEHDVFFDPASGNHINSTSIAYEDEQHHYLNHTVTITLEPDYDYLLPATSDVTSATANDYFTFDNCRFESYTLANDTKTADLKIKIGKSETEIIPGDCTVTAKKAMIQKEHEVTFSSGTTTGLEQSGVITYDGGKAYHNKIATINLVITSGKDYQLPSSITTATASDWFTFDNCRFESYSNGVLKVKIGKSDSEGPEGINEGGCTVTLKKNPARNHHTITMNYPNGNIITGPASAESGDDGVATISNIAVANGKDYQDLVKDRFSIDGSPANVSITSFTGNTLTVTFNDDYSSGNISITCNPIRNHHTITMNYPSGIGGPNSVNSDDDGVATITGIAATKSAYQDLSINNFAINGSPTNVSITGYNVATGTLTVEFNDNYSGNGITVDCTAPDLRSFTVTMNYPAGTVTGDLSGQSDGDGVATISNIAIVDGKDYQALDQQCFSIDNSPAGVSITDFAAGVLTVTFTSDYSGNGISITCNPKRNHHTLNITYQSSYITGPANAESNDEGIATISGFTISSQYIPTFSCTDTHVIVSYEGGILTVKIDDDYSSGSIVIYANTTPAP